MSIWAPVAGFLEQQTIQQNADLLDEINFFWYTLGAGGSIDGGIMAAEAVQAARDAGLRVVPSIVNGGFDAQRVSLVVNDPARRKQHIQDILALIEAIEAGATLPDGMIELVDRDYNPEILTNSIVYRGLETTGERSEGELRELYFPLPYNDEQVNIIQRLEVIQINEQ